tara:strand:+ start:289 stop:837 length:549 start_codon:yes stop_codon:yes gene_type:complete
MLNSGFYAFLYYYGGYIILAVSALSIVILFLYRIKNQDEDEGRIISHQDRSFKKKGIDINLKMQAYERLTIFLERTDPVKLLSMIDKKERNIEKIELHILQTIFSEFEYNISQQVYISDILWDLIIASKNKNISLISSVKKSLNKGASGNDFFNALKLVLENKETTPSKIALSYLKKEVRSI